MPLDATVRARNDVARALVQGLVSLLPLFGSSRSSLDSHATFQEWKITRQQLQRLELYSATRTQPKNALAVTFFFFF